MNTIDMLTAHTSVRQYTDKPVSLQDRTRILEAAFAASSSCFLQLVSIVRVTDAALRQTLFEASGSQPQVLSAPEFWVFCADYHRDQLVCENADLGWTEQLVTASLDVGICAQNAMAALESFGLGGCFIGGIRNHIEDVDQALGLPQNVVPLLGLAFGHPAYFNEVKPRLPQSVTVMENRYAEPEAAALADYDRVTGEYFASRRRNPRKETWSAGVEGTLKKERRPFVLDFLHSKGFALK